VTGTITGLAQTTTVNTYTAKQHFSAGISSFGATFDNHIHFRKKLNDGTFLQFASGFYGDGSFRIGFGDGPYLTGSLQSYYPNLVIGNGLRNTTSTGSAGNIAIGFDALGHSGMSGSSNVAVGFSTLKSLGIVQGSDISNLSGNTVVGHNSLDALQIGQRNTSFGYLGGTFLKRGDRNTFVGAYAGAFSYQGFLASASGCISIGDFSAPRGTPISGTDRQSFNEIVIAGPMFGPTSFTYTLGMGPNTTTIGNTACNACLINGRLNLRTGLSVTGSIRLNSTVVAGSIGSLIGTEDEGSPLLLSTENFTADNQSILMQADGPLGQFVITNRLASTSLTGVASFNSEDFLVSSTGSVSILDSSDEGTVVRTNISAPTQIFSELQRFASGISSSYLVSGGGTFDGTLNANLFVGNIAGGTF
jgi:hypothetical protein